MPAVVVVFVALREAVVCVPTDVCRLVTAPLLLWLLLVAFALEFGLVLRLSRAALILAVLVPPALAFTGGNARSGCCTEAALIVAPLSLLGALVVCLLQHVTDQLLVYLLLASVFLSAAPNCYLFLHGIDTRHPNIVVVPGAAAVPPRPASPTEVGDPEESPTAASA